MNQAPSKGKVSSGFLPNAISNLPAKVDFKQPCTLKNLQNPCFTGVGIYFPSETVLGYTAAKRNSLHRIPHKRSRSVNRTREPSSGLSVKEKGSLEKITLDQNGSISNNDLSYQEALKGEKRDSSKYRENVNTQTWYGQCTRSEKVSKTIANASSVKAKDVLKEVDNSQFISEGASKDCIDSMEDKAKGNVAFCFGKPMQLMGEQINRNLNVKTSASSKRDSPFASKKLPDNSPLQSNKSFKEISQEFKSPSVPKKGGERVRPGYGRVQRCQSYRTGSRKVLNTSADNRVKIEECYPHNIEVKAAGKPVTNQENVKVPEKVVDDKEEKKNADLKYQLYPSPQVLFSKLASPNILGNKAGSGRISTANPIVRKKVSGLNMGSLNVLNKQSRAVDNTLCIENYRIEKVIGQGSYAVVRLAVNKENNEKVAIKSYDKFKLNDTQKRNNVKREISILKSVDHPNIIKLHKTVDTVTQTHLIMELPSMQSLHTYLKSKPFKRLPEDEAKKIFKQILSGLSYLHQKNICHRDIKLENLLLDENLTVKIIDFGFGVENPKEKTMNVFCGTPSYMAPELAAKKEYYGHLTDIWAAGVLLYVLLSGYFPFRDSNEKELFKKIARGQYEFSSQVSEDAKALIKKMLRMNPLERLSAEEILQDKWLTGQQNHNSNLKNYLDAKIQHYRNIQVVKQPETVGIRA